MPAALVISYALEALNAIPKLIAAGQSIMALVNHTTAAMQNMLAENRGPTPEEWAALDAMTDALRTELHKGEK